VSTGAQVFAAQIVRPGKLAAEFKPRNYPEAGSGKILGGNLLTMLRNVHPKSSAHPR
jgi:hypothetical protein